MAIRALVFDLFDTLVDLPLPPFVPGEPAEHAKRVHHALTAHVEVGFETFQEGLAHVDRTLLRPAWRDGREVGTLDRFTAFAAHVGIDHPDVPASMTEAHMGMLAEHAASVDHHPEVMARLRTRLPTALCSNFTHAPTARSILERARLDDHLDVVVISEEVGWRKPRPEIFRAVFEGLGCEPQDVLHVGDNLVADVQGASALGCRTAWITRCVADPAKKLAEYDGPPPDHTIADLGELEGLVEV